MTNSGPLMVVLSTHGSYAMEMPTMPMDHGQQPTMGQLVEYPQPQGGCVTQTSSYRCYIIGLGGTFPFIKKQYGPILHILNNSMVLRSQANLKFHGTALLASASPQE